MNIRKQITSGAVALMLTLTLVIPSRAATAPFTDLAGISAKNKILALQAEGFVKGIGRGLFAPNRTVSAAEGIQMIVTSLKLNIDDIRFIKAPQATDYFKKADNGAWYANTFIIASVKGFELPADLDPNQAWTREEFTYYLIRAMEIHGNLPMIKLIPVDISDEDRITVDYSGAVQRALVYKVVTLDNQCKFAPQRKITRAEAAEQIYNALEYLNAHPAPTN